jgi:hypothetical protein
LASPELKLKCVDCKSSTLPKAIASLSLCSKNGLAGQMFFVVVVVVVVVIIILLNKQSL